MGFRSIILGIAVVVAASVPSPAQAAPGDMNCDALVNGLDIGPFVLALHDPSGYAAAYPGCELSNADFDCDGDATVGDVTGFIDYLLTDNYSPCGACCLTDGGCTVSPQTACTGTWQGVDTSCSPDPCTTPTAGMVLIPAGSFDMGDMFNEGLASEQPVHSVYISAFYMDIYEVTNQQYADALNWAWSQGNLINISSGAVFRFGGTSILYCDTTTNNLGSWITWNDTTFGVVAGKANHPMVRVSWYGSAAYSNWRSGMQGRTPCYDTGTWACNFAANGYRLPTEAEWEKAARGGASGRRFPWADQDTIQHARANYSSLTSYAYNTSPTSGYHPIWGVGNFPYTSPVGFFTGALQQKTDWNWPGSGTSYQTANGANGYGFHDMAGNVWEWCNDWYQSNYYSISPGTDPRGPSSGNYRVLRGGSWISPADFCRCSNRIDYSPDFRHTSSGFRLALDSD